MKKKLVKIS